MKENHHQRSKVKYVVGRAVVLTSLTTLVGFDSIALSYYPGLRSMRYVAYAAVPFFLPSGEFFLTCFLVSPIAREN